MARKDLSHRIWIAEVQCDTYPRGIVDAPPLSSVRSLYPTPTQR